MSLVAALALVMTAAVWVGASNPAQACPTAISGRYLGSWEGPSLGGAVKTDLLFTGGAVTGTLEFVTGTTVVGQGSTISGTESCGSIAGMVGQVNFTGTISPSGTEIVGAWDYFGTVGTWRGGLVQEQVSGSGTTLTTDDGTPGATPTDPVETTVMSPVAGPITIEEAISTGGSLGGFTVLGTVVRITAPSASSPSDPLRFRFVVDASVTGGVPAGGIEVFRDGIVVGDCLSPAVANPAPCVASRVDDPSGDVIIDVNTLAASIWNFGVSPSDVTPPLIAPTVVGTLGNDGWYTSDVTVSWSATDPESTVASTSGCGPVIVTSDTDGITFACSATSAGGTSSSSVTIKRDATAPVVAPSVNPDPVLLNGPASASPNASDQTSGVVASSCGAVSTSAVGPGTVTCTATDAAGNEGTGTAGYSVRYAFVGYASPVDNGGVLNRAKAGQAIPLKWRLLDAGGQPVTNLTNAMVRVTTLACPLGTTVDQIEEYSASAVGLNNLGNGYYSFVWKSPSTYAGSCKTLSIDLGEGITRDALFQFTR